MRCSWCQESKTIVNLNLLWSEFVEADRNVASFKQTRPKVSLNLLSSGGDDMGTMNGPDGNKVDNDGEYISRRKRTRPIRARLSTPDCMGAGWLWAGFVHSDCGWDQSETSQIFPPLSIRQFCLIVPVVRFCTSIVGDKWRADLHAFPQFLRLRENASMRFWCGGSSFLFHWREFRYMPTLVCVILAEWPHLYNVIYYFGST